MVVSPEQCPAAFAAVVPAGRHRAMALTAVQESMWAANAGIACDTPREDADA